MNPSSSFVFRNAVKALRPNNGSLMFIDPPEEGVSCRTKGRGNSAGGADYCRGRHL